MKAVITKVADGSYQELRQIDTLEDILAVIDEFGEDVILSRTSYLKDIADIEIMIYDGHLE